MDNVGEHRDGTGTPVRGDHAYGERHPLLSIPEIFRTVGGRKMAATFLARGNAKQHMQRVAPSQRNVRNTGNADSCSGALRALLRRLISVVRRNPRIHA
jgi:hypothetical protein